MRNDRLPLFCLILMPLFFLGAAAAETAEAVHSSRVISPLLQPFPTLLPTGLIGPEEKRKRRRAIGCWRLAAGDVTPPVLSRAQHVTLSKAGTLRPVSKFSACINTARFFFLLHEGGLFFFLLSVNEPLDAEGRRAAQVSLSSARAPTSPPFATKMTHFICRRRGPGVHVQSGGPNMPRRRDFLSPFAALPIAGIHLHICWFFFLDIK